MYIDTNIIHIYQKKRYGTRGNFTRKPNVQEFQVITFYRSIHITYSCRVPTDTNQKELETMRGKIG